VILLRPARRPRPACIQLASIQPESIPHSPCSPPREPGLFLCTTRWIADGQEESSRIYITPRRP
jgi:hypothetical protein